MKKEFQRNLSSLSLIPEDRVQTVITSRPGINGVAGALGDKLI